MRSSPAANNNLRALMSEAGWNGGELARAINAVARENGLSLEYRRASVGQWLSGTRPRPPVPDLVAEALSRALARPVTPVHAGFGARAGAPGMPVATADQLDWLVEPGRSGRLEPRRCVYELRAGDPPHLSGSSHARLTARTGTRTRVGPGDVGSATAALRLFSEADETLGGGMMRIALADYLAGTVARWLSADTESDEVRRDLLVVASELAYLCGFMCFDDELNGPAQRYYRIALRLAAEAGDTTRHAIALRAMSVQASALGHRGHAADIAEAAVATATTEVHSSTRAFLLGQAAVAAAAIGDRRRAATALGAAERHLGRPAGDVSVGAYHSASLAHQRAAVAALCGDRRAAIAALEESIRLRPPAEHRARVIILARLAELRLDCGLVDETAATWHHFLDSYPNVRSGRARTAMGTLRARMRPHQNQPKVRGLLDRARMLRR